MIKKYLKLKEKVGNDNLKIEEKIKKLEKERESNLKKLTDYKEETLNHYFGQLDEMKKVLATQIESDDIKNFLFLDQNVEIKEEKTVSANEEKLDEGTENYSFSDEDFLEFAENKENDEF